MVSQNSAVFWLALMAKSLGTHLSFVTIELR